MCSSSDLSKTDSCLASCSFLAVSERFNLYSSCHDTPPNQPRVRPSECEKENVDSFRNCCLIVRRQYENEWLNVAILHPNHEYEGCMQALLLWAFGHLTTAASSFRFLVCSSFTWSSLVRLGCSKSQVITMVQEMSSQYKAPSMHCCIHPVAFYVRVCQPPCV
jgi:hypothetical protein